MKRILFFPVVLAIVCQLRSTAGYPEPPAPKKVTTFVTYAYEQGDEPIQVPVPSGSFNTPELSADHTGLSAESSEIENFSPQVQHPDLARDLQPPREVVGLQGPEPITIPIPQQPLSAPASSSPVNLEEINIIHENEPKANQVVDTPTSKIFPAKTQSFQIIKAPMIQEHSVTSDGDFMKALAHAFGVTNRFVLHSQLERGLRAPEAITTPLPPSTVEQTISGLELPASVTITENPFSKQELLQQQKQSLQAALIQSLQRLNAPPPQHAVPIPIQITQEHVQQSRENGVYQHIYSHSASAPTSHEEIPTESAQSQVPPPPQYQFTFHVADGGRKELSGPDTAVSLAAAPKEVVIQEEVKVPIGQIQQGLYNTEVLSAPVAQQVEQPQPPPQQQQLPQFLSAVTPSVKSVIRKFKPIAITASRQVTETPLPPVLIANSVQAPAPVVAPIKFSDSTAVSKTTFTRVRPQVLLYRDQQGNIQQTTPSQLQENQINQQYVQANPQQQPGNPVNQQQSQENLANQQYIQVNPLNQQQQQVDAVNQQHIQDNPTNQQYIQENPANQQYIQENPENQQYIPENQANQQYIQENPANQQYTQGNPANQQYIQENGEYTEKNIVHDPRPQQVFSPANALSGESQKQIPQQQQRFVYRYLTNEAGAGGVSNEQISAELPDSSTEQFDSQDVEGKYAIFEPQKVIQNVNGAGQPVGIVFNGNQFRRRRPNGRRLKVRRKKVKVRRLAPAQIEN